MCAPSSTHDLVSQTAASPPLMACDLVMSKPASLLQLHRQPHPKSHHPKSFLLVCMRSNTSIIDFNIVIIDEVL